MTRDFLRAAVAGAIGDLTGHSLDRISDADDLADDLGVDSMASVNLLVAIEDRVGTRIPDGAEGSLVGIRTVGDVVDRLVSLWVVDAGPLRMH